MQAVVFETEEESARCSAEDVVSGYIAVLPWQGANIVENGIALLAGGDENGRGRGAGGEGLRLGLLDLGSCGGGAGRGTWVRVLSINSVHNGSEVCIITKFVSHDRQQSARRAGSQIFSVPRHSHYSFGVMGAIRSAGVVTTPKLPVAPGVIGNCICLGIAFGGDHEYVYASSDMEGLFHIM